ncbi:marginal zone B- and B1-cell-specific protein-like [Diadema antillarum]|uniref:marginal zone B- and B1-cell-specific protein-like n=1 Tax=Diadema antillarum TaxID=105358 RepID=UPI003A87B02B
MFGPTKTTRCIFLLAFLLLCLISIHVASAQEGDVPLKRGPRRGFEKDSPPTNDFEEEWDPEEGDEEEEEEEEEEVPARPPGEQSLGTINFSTPDLDDEEYHSPHLPGAMKCDACSILTHMMVERLDAANKKRPSLKKKLPESEIIDIFEDLCDDEFNNVGIKEVNGKKRLSGPGSKIADTPGIMQGGGKWPFRMMQMCQGYLGDFGEEELYQFYLQGQLKKKVCSGPQGVCRKEKKKASSKKEPKKKKAKNEL